MMPLRCTSLRWRAFAPAALCALGAGALGFALWLAAVQTAPVAAQSPFPGASPVSDCLVSAHTAVHPQLAQLPQVGGDEDPVLVSVRLHTSCRAAARPSHVALVVDRAVLAEGSADDMAGKLAALPADLQLGSQTYARIGRVDYDKLVRVRCPMTNDADVLSTCMVGTAPEGLAGTAEGLSGALGQTVDMLRSARATRYPPHVRGLDPLVESIVIVASEPSTSCPAAQQAVQQARDEGIDVDVLCAGGDCRDGCLASLALPGALHTDVDRDWPQVKGWIGNLVRSTELRVRQLQITEWMHPAFDVLPESLDASRVTYDTDSRRLQWDVEDVGSRVRYAYALRPLETGRHQVRRVQYPYKGSFVDTRGRVGSIHLGNPVISVIDHPPVRIQLPWLSRPGSRAGFRPFGSP